MKDFVIQSPWWLWLLLLVPVLGVLQSRARRLREQVTAGMGGGATPPTRVRDALRLAAVGLLLLALARPGHSPQRRSVSQSGRDVVFAIDVSRSMLAEDAYPSRLEAAKQGVRDALESFRTERAGLVIYAGSATILCPLTHDHDFVRYMLDQAAPRAVDFGGTTLLSAVEKSVDNLFSDERRGMQDLVVFSDGEDHGPELARVARLLDEADVDLLLVGLGDASVGSRIPVEDEDGVRSHLKHEGDFVETRLNEEFFEALRSELPEASYVVPGTSPFDGAAIHAAHVEGKPTEGAVGADSFVVYREAGIPLIAVAVLLLMMAEQIGRGGRLVTRIAVLGGWLLVPGMGKAAGPGDVFERARQQQVEGRYGEALERYGEAAALQVGPEVAAVIRFNQGLCQLAEAEAVAEEAPENALAMARSAQALFLQAMRMDPGLERAGRRLDGTAERIAGYEAAVEAREEEDREAQEQISKLVELLEKLRDEQVALHGSLLKKAPGLGRRRQAPASGDAATKEAAQRLASRQDELVVDGREIQRVMEQVDAAMGLANAGGGPPSESLMKEPRRLMAKVVANQVVAAEKLAQRSGWEVAGARQQDAVRGIEAILELLAGDSSAEPGEEEDYGEDWEEGDYEEAEDGSPSSMPMSGDLASGSEMQPLPVPNYSVEDLLMEEQGNLQFRQQQRAKANAGNVEKDW